MEKPTANEIWYITRKRVVESLYKHFHEITHKKGNRDEEIDKMMELIAKDEGTTPDKVREFLLIDKIIDEVEIEGNRLREEAKMKAHEEREIRALEKSKLNFQKNRLKYESKKIQEETDKIKNK